MKHAVDTLTTGLLHSNGFSGHIPVANMPGPSNMAPAAPGTSSHGHRILPVYVFSLLGMEKSLLFDHRHVHTASSSAVLVLQTGSQAIPLPYFSQTGIVHVNARSPTRHIVAGLATAIGGLMNPYERYSKDSASVLHDYLWANGHHPFGPWSNTPAVSTLFVDAALRNSIISRVEHSLSKVRKAVKLVDGFTNEYVRDPFGDKISFEDSNFDSLLEFWSSKTMSAQSPLAASVVTRLEQQLTQLSSLYEQLAKHFKEYELDAANTLSGSIDLATTSFSHYVQEEIQSARLALKCCSKQHQIAPAAVASRWSFVTFAGLIIAGLCVGTWVYGVSDCSRVECCQLSVAVHRLIAVWFVLFVLWCRCDQLIAPPTRRPGGSSSAWAKGASTSPTAAVQYRFGGTTIGTPNPPSGSDRAHRY